MFVEQSTVFFLFPEIILIAMATWIYVGGTFTRSRAWWATFALLTYVVAAAVLLQQGSFGPGGSNHVFVQAGSDQALSGPLAIDSLGYMIRWLGLGVGFLFTLVAFRTANRQLASEFLGTLMMTSAGIMLVAHANELVFLFVSLELVSIPTYVLLFLGRKDRQSGEATVKYFFLSIFSSAVLLYGFSFLYGIAGTTLIAGTADTPGIREALSLIADGGGTDGDLLLAAVAAVLIMAGLGFKLTAVPFHFYAPDVYEGTTNLNAGLLAVAPKIVGVVAIVRLIVVAMPIPTSFAWQVALVLSILTMTLGNVCALWQTNLRRMMAYSSVAHAGYLLIGISTGVAGGIAGGYGGVAAAVFYIAVYTLASIGMFAALAYLGGEQRDVCKLDELSGLAKRRPLVAAAIAVFMFSLAGIPPLAGFWGKLTLFIGAIDVAHGSIVDNEPLVARWFIALAVVGALNAAIAAAYYLRVVAVMYFRPTQEEMPREAGGMTATAVAVCAALVVLIGVVPGPVLRTAGLAERSVLRVEESASAAADQPVRDVTMDVR